MRGAVRCVSPETLLVFPPRAVSIGLSSGWHNAGAPDDEISRQHRTAAHSWRRKTFTKCNDNRHRRAENRAAEIAIVAASEVPEHIGLRNRRCANQLEVLIGLSRWPDVRTPASLIGLAPWHCALVVFMLPLSVPRVRRRVAVLTVTDWPESPIATPIIPDPSGNAHSNSYRLRPWVLGLGSQAVG